MKKLFMALLIFLLPLCAFSISLKKNRAEILNAFYDFSTKNIYVKLRYKQTMENQNFKLKIIKCSKESPFVCSAYISYDDSLDETENKYVIENKNFLIPENIIPSFIKLKSNNYTTFFIPVFSSSPF